MTIMLNAMRASIICWVFVALAPIELVYDAIESEIERRERRA